MKGLVFALAALLAVSNPAAVVKEYVRIDGTTDVAPLPGRVLQADMFADDALWKKPDIHGGRGLNVSRKDGKLTVGGLVTNRMDTAWSLSTKRLPLTVSGLGYALSFFVQTKPLIRNTGGGSRYSCAVVWYDHGGQQIERDPFALGQSSELRTRKVLVGSVPLAAESYSIQLGFDRPNLFAKQGVRIDGLSFSVMEKERDPAWTPQPEREPPRVRVVSETPFGDPKADLRVAIESVRPVDWSKVSFRVDGKDATAGFVRDGNVFTYRVDGVWGRCLHTVDVVFADPETGETKTAHKTILCGEPPTTAKVRLREDGVALVGGEPFFPIGLYSVCEREFNGNSLDKAFEDLKAAGVNTVHSYSETRGERFLSAADRHGLKVWSAVWKADKAFVDRTRHHPSVLAWYVGDDTSMHAEPSEVYDRSDSVLSADPTRITVQADVMNSGDAVSSYRAFVKTTDVFMPEIYPCQSAERVPQPDCVALAIRDMKRFRQDVAEAKDVRPKAVWPILQYFDGWNTWKRFPTRDELFAMSFATLVHGAQGITWYTYGGFPEPKKNRINRGVTATPEIWANFTNLTSRIAELVPALTMPPPQPKPAKVVSGPDRDPLGNASISVSLRRAGCDAYLLAVNSACSNVTAIVDVFDANVGEVEVMWENRRVKVPDGTVREDFAPFAVHVYHWRTPDVKRDRLGVLQTTAPRDGATVPLLSAEQKGFMRMSREERAIFFDDEHKDRERAIKKIGSTPLPVRLAWTGGKAPYAVTVTKHGATKPFFVVSVTNDSVEVWNCEIAADYDWTVSDGTESAKSAFRTEDQAPRLLRWTGTRNVRDMGGRVMPNGRRVRQGLVFRSAGLNDNAKKGDEGPGKARLSPETVRYVLDTFGIRTDIDLRSDRELNGMSVSPLGPTVRFVHEWDNYRDYAQVHRGGKEATAFIFRLMTDRANYPIDFHCIGGADRTGTVASLLHGILGASDEDIWKDYQVTAWQGGVNDAKHLGWFKSFVKSFDKYEGSTLSERIVAYFRDIGFSDAELDKIRDILLE